MTSSSIRFATSVHEISAVLHASGLRSPVFRTPPKIVGASRTLRTRSDGSVVAAVTVKGRPWSAVLADLVECAVRANDLNVVEAARLRDDLWLSMEATATKAA